MKTIETLVLEPADFKNGKLDPKAEHALLVANLVLYRGEVVKNRSGKITARLDVVCLLEKMNSGAVVVVAGKPSEGKAAFSKRVTQFIRSLNLLRRA